MHLLQLVVEKQRLQGKVQVVDTVSAFANATIRSCSEQLSLDGPNRDRDGALTEAALLETIDTSVTVRMSRALDRSVELMTSLLVQALRDSVTPTLRASVGGTSSVELLSFLEAQLSTQRDQLVNYASSSFARYV